MPGSEVISDFTLRRIWDTTPTHGDERCPAAAEKDVAFRSHTTILFISLTFVKGITSNRWRDPQP